jgi:branched-chain amino acid transport system substrate-binding protein
LAFVVAAGGKTWFFLTPDFAFCHAMEKAGRTAIEAAGGEVLGSVQYPITTTDFASYLVTASSSPAQVIGISGVGGAAISVVKQAVEFGVTSHQRRLAIFLQFITDIDGLGLASSHGLYTADGFYWDQNDKTREWSKRLMAQHGTMPTKVQAYTYAIVLHYLKSIATANSIEPEKVRAKMGEASLDLFGNAATIRPNGRAVYHLTLYEVKKPTESKYPWDYYRPVREISGFEAFGPPSESKCVAK